jgi:hypothetical protein
MDLGSLWGILTIVGPIVLAVAIAWAMFHNRSSPADIARTEEATHRMYDEQNREDQARDAQ